jgi:hypothetical protein
MGKIAARGFHLGEAANGAAVIRAQGDGLIV